MSESICSECSSWMDYVPKPINGFFWMKCRTCGYMKKVNKFPVKTIGGK